MRKILLIFFVLLSFFFSPKTIHAQDNFDISTEANYTVNEFGVTTIVQSITIVNKKEFIYTPSYKIVTGLKDISSLSVFNSNGAIPYDVKKVGDENEINISFLEKSVGLLKSTTFTVSFETHEIAKKRGSIWEIDIPGLSNPNDYSSYNVSLTVPPSFGKVSVIKPPNKFNGNVLSFDKKAIGESGIFVLFGDSQIYKMSLTYHISNPNLFPIKTEIALPPDTAYQDIYLNSLDPKPLNVYNDQDGNWLAVYGMPPKSQKTVVAKLIASVYSSPRSGFKENLATSAYTSSAKYWESDNSQIQNIAKNLHSPYEVYKYVVSILTYDYGKASDNKVRLGAIGALNNPKNAVCLEFTDLFIALARAAGIPARAVEGYANTQNSKLRPLSLVKDVLHAWPEYYDFDKKQWVMVDPTWGNTTSGLDYFYTLDFDHVVFVVKGKDSSYPVPAGGYKVNSDSKDISVSFADKSALKVIDKFDVKPDFSDFNLSGLPVRGRVIVTNLGNRKISAKPLVVNSTFPGFRPEEASVNLLPYSSKIYDINFKRTPFLTNNTYEVTISFDGNTYRKNIKISVFPSAGWLILLGGGSFGSVIFIIIAYKTRGLLFQKLRK